MYTSVEKEISDIIENRFQYQQCYECRVDVDGFYLGVKIQSESRDSFSSWKVYVDDRILCQKTTETQARYGSHPKGVYINEINVQNHLVAPSNIKFYNIILLAVLHQLTDGESINLFMTDYFMNPEIPINSGDSGNLEKYTPDNSEYNSSNLEDNDFEDGDDILAVGLAMSIIDNDDD